MPPRASTPKAPGKVLKKKRTIETEIGDLVLESDAENTERPKKRKRKPNERTRKKDDLEHSSVWFDPAIARDLWMPEKMELEKVNKPKRTRKPRRDRQERKHWNKGRPGQFWRRPRRESTRRAQHVRERVPGFQRSVEPLLTSWFEIENFIDEPRAQQWRTDAMPAAPVSREIVDELRDLGVLMEDDVSVNSVIKLRLFPSKTQKEKLDQMFAANRAVYNKLVGQSMEDCRSRFTSRVKSTKMTVEQICQKYRPIAKLKTMDKYFRNKKGLLRHREVPDEVRDSAFRDFKKALKASIAGFFAKLGRDESTTYPVLRFKSKFAPSNSIEIMARSFKVVHTPEHEKLHFKPKYFGFDKQDGIVLHERLPELIKSVRLQRLREGEYFLIVPRKREFTRSKTERVCAIDPGVRNFVSVYDPEGRTFSVTDAHSVLKKKFEAVDKMKSKLAIMDNESKAKHTEKIATRRKRGRRHSKTKAHRQRYRLRRQIRCTSRKATRAVNDMHQKLASWLSANYYNVLLPSFQTSQMVQKYLTDVASDATPETTSEEERASIQKRKMRSPTARAMLAQAHYRFKMLLKYKMDRAGGRVIDCEEEYTSKTCSACGEIKNNLGGNHVFKCGSCPAVLDRDISAAKNIFHKNMSKLG